MAKKQQRKQRPSGQRQPTGSVSCNGSDRRFSSARFAGAFGLSCIVLFALINSAPEWVTGPINRHTAAALGLMLNVFGAAVTVSGDIVSSGGVAFRIVPECTPVFTGGLFLCFVAWYPASLRDKAAGLFAGLLFLAFGNLLRLVGTFLISRYDRSLFEIVHVYLGQVMSVALVIIACMAWLRWLGRGSKPQGIAMEGAAFLARFVLISGALFLLWVQIHHGYIAMLDFFMTRGFSLFGEPVQLARQTPYYYETFSIVVFASLVFAVRALQMRARLICLAAGLTLLFCIHLLHRIDNALIARFHITAGVPADLTLLVAGQYLVPVLFLVYWSIRHTRSLSRKR